MKVRKKPIIVDAYQINHDTREFLSEWADLTWCETGLSYTKYMIPTLEGIHECAEGDYIIRGVEGEYYPIKKHIFEKTYEVINE